MSRRSRGELTEDETAYLKSASSVPDEIKSFVARQHDQIGLRTSAYAKVAAAAKAEADALLAVRMLEAVRGELTDLAEMRRTAIEAQSTVRTLRGEIDEKDRRIRELLAGPLMAVNSDD